MRVKEVGLVYRIMIVEDDRELRETLKELLILKNYDVITSGSVKEFDEHTDIYDMYLLDVKLPDGDGFDICERIRHNSDAPIIFITSCDDEESIIKGLDMGGDDYVTKPFHNAVLLSRISANLRRRDMNSGDVYNKGSLSVHFDQYKLYRDGKELKLSSNEWDIIKILIENKGMVSGISTKSGVDNSYEIISTGLAGIEGKWFLSRMGESGTPWLHDRQ